MNDNSALGRITLSPQRSSSDPVVSGQTTFLFDVYSASDTSSIFTVADLPITIFGFNFTSGDGETEADLLTVEQVVFDPMGNMVTQEVVIDGVALSIDQDNVQLEITRSGLYRCILSADAVGQVTVTATNNHVPSGIISHGK